MSSIEPHGEKLRHLRRALRWTQLELALRAGVSERMVRNAERGRPVRRDFLEYLAGALGVDLRELAHEPAAVAGLVRWQHNASALMENLVRYQYEHDAHPIMEMLHRNCHLEISYDSEQEIYAAGMAGEMKGTFVGASGLQRSIDNSLELDSRLIERGIIFHTPVGDDDLIILRGIEVLTDDQGRRESVWTVQSYEFEDQRVVRIHNHCGSLGGMNRLDGVASTANRNGFVTIPTSSGRSRQVHFLSGAWKYQHSPRRY